MATLAEEIAAAEALAARAAKRAADAKARARRRLHKAITDRLVPLLDPKEGSRKAFCDAAGELYDDLVGDTDIDGGHDDDDAADLHGHMQPAPAGAEMYPGDDDGHDHG